MMRSSLFGCLVVGLSWSCATESAPPLPANFAEACQNVEGCQSPVVPAPGERVGIWRVLVVRDAEGATTIEAVQELDAAASVGAPQGPTHGVLGLAALDAAGEPLELQLVRFPDEGHVKFADGSDELFDATGRRVSFVGYLEVQDAAATLALVQGDGTVMHSIPAPAPGEAIPPAEKDSSGSAEIGGTSQTLTQAAPGSACSHVMILDGIVDAVWNDSGYTPLRPTLTQRAVIQSALGRMTPTHCMGLARIVLVDSSETNEDGSLRATRVGGWVSSASGDLMAINVAVDAGDVSLTESGLQSPHAVALLTGIVVHEAAHATTNLFNSITEDVPSGLAVDFMGRWRPTQRTLADATIANARLGGDFWTLWREMHDSFEDLGWADNHCESVLPIECGPRRSALFNDVCDGAIQLCADAVRDDGIDETTANGFMSHYGATMVSEDIAEFATWPLVARLYQEAGVDPGPGAGMRGYGCLAMQAHSEANVPSGLSAAFTKLTFLRDLGMVTEADYQWCLGDSLGLSTRDDGFTIYEGGDVQNTFGNVPEAGIGTRDGRYVFTFDARGSVEVAGEPFAAVLNLEIDLGPAERDGQAIPIDQISWPRGAFRISQLTPHALRLRIADSPAQNFDVTDGFILSAAASNDRLTGSVFVTEVWRYQSPIPVPEVYDPPLIFRYSLGN